jgi:hypothetical protein
VKGALPMIAALLILFLGAGVAGVWLAGTFAPGSFLAEAVSMFALPVAFAISLQAWYGLALFGAFARLLWHRGRLPRPAPHAPARLSGSIVFLPVSSIIGAVTGLVVGLLSSTHPTWIVAFVYWIAGTVHGAAGWRLARSGVLVPPESI